MIRNLSFFVLFFIAWMYGITSHAENKNLFIVINQNLSKNDEAENYSQLYEHTYFAKKYEVVKVNFDLLLKNDKEFIVRMPNGEKLRFNRDSIDNIADANQFWVGTILPENANLSAIEDDKEKQELVRTLSLHRLLIQDVEISNKNDHKSQDPIRMDKSPGGNRAYTINGKISPLGSKNKYEIFPLDNNPNLHILMELDQDKLIYQGMSDIKERKKKYKEHLEKKQKSTTTLK
ncbi:hypothetical protein [Microbulbifer magnicolonia]|uniref:hypothetical protein n=1 Tax=Microbulbifer magnicolonia TaxID=3109744 RepID=UPI002B400C58|nr:hypothetical protein [Microbulbifer sp. GG15]